MTIPSYLPEYTSKTLLYKQNVQASCGNDSSISAILDCVNRSLVHSDKSVCWSVCLFVSLCVRQSVFSSVCVFVSLCVCQSVCLSVCVFVSLFVCQSVCSSVCVFVSLFVCQSVCLSVCVFVSLCGCQSVCLSVCLLVSLFVGQSVCLSVCLFVSLFVCKACKEKLSHPLMMLWEQSFAKGKIPSSLKDQFITPIFKKGSKSDPANLTCLAYLSCY